MPARKPAAAAPAKRPAAKAAAASAASRRAKTKEAEAPAKEETPAPKTKAAKPAARPAKAAKPSSGSGSVVRARATLYYVHHRKPNEMSGKFQADVCHLSDAAVEALEELGIDVRYESEDEAIEKARERAERNNREFDPDNVVARGYFVTVKSERPLRIADADGVLLDDDVMVGTGTTAIVALSSYSWEFKGKTGVSANLRSCRVQELVEATGAEDPLDDEEAPIL